MVKELHFSEVIPNVTAQEVFRSVWGTDYFVKEFHLVKDNDPSTVATDWENGRRTVAFTTPVNAPSLVKKVIGFDVVPVMEEQIARITEETITIESMPIPDIPGGSRFSTLVTIILKDTGDGCRMDATVACSATGLGWMTSTIEPFLGEAASKGMREFLDFMKDYLLGNGITEVPLSGGEERVAAEEEKYYDAQDMETVAALPPPGTMLFEDALLHYLRFMCAKLNSIDQSLNRNQETGFLPTLQNSEQRHLFLSFCVGATAGIGIGMIISKYRNP